MEKQYNLRSPAVKRLMREAKELRNATELYHAQPLEDNLFEWHFTVRGPPDTEFAGGRYHGRIILPPEYPMKPPSIMLLTPNGRFEIGKKICLSMSAHHPETWQPSWSIRTVLMAIIGFMPTKGAGAIGALDYTPKERAVLARKSMEWKCSTCGSCNSNSLPEGSSDSTETKEVEREIEELAGQIAFKEEDEKNKKTENSEREASSAPGPTPTAGTTGFPVPPVSAEAGNIPNPWLQAANQQPYMAYNPYYQFNYPYFYGQMPPNMAQGMANQSTAFPPAANQEEAATTTNQPSGSQAYQATSPVANQNQAASPTANQNAQNDSVLRQRTQTQATQPPAMPQPPSANNAGVVARPHPSHTGMASLIILWLLGVSIVALVLRRIFMV